MKPTKENLIAAAEDMNKVLELDPPIKAGRRVTTEQLTSDISDAADLVKPEDSLMPQTRELLKAIGLIPAGDSKAPETKAPETKAPETKAPETKAADPKPETKKKAPAAPKPKAYNRTNSVVDAINAGAKDFDDLVKKSNALYIKAGKKDNVKEATWLCNIVTGALNLLGYKWTK